MPNWGFEIRASYQMKEKVIEGTGLRVYGFCNLRTIE